MGAAFSLLMMLGSLAMTVFMITKGHVGGSLIMTILTVMFGVSIVLAGDWQNVWKPLFTRKR